MGGVPPASVPVPRDVWRGGRGVPGARVLAEEVAVAVSYNNATHAVMMASPVDLEDFAVGFSLSESIIGSPGEIQEIEIVPVADGIDLRVWVSGDVEARLALRRRRVLGASGCGMCGMESLAEANRAVPRVAAGGVVSAGAIGRAMAAMRPAQALNAATHAVHAAGFWREDAPLLLREDVGRHNALDKLSGAMSRAGLVAAAGIVVLSSRVSVEMAQKAAILGAPVLAAISAPTALAVRVARAAGMTLVGIAREDGFEVFCGAERIGE